MTNTRGTLLDRYLAARKTLAWKRAVTRQYNESVSRLATLHREAVKTGA